ncbi:MAG: hypothetical protein RI993_1188 [Pseudomonadota bacterium]|nr:DUF4879 domain-containing protein [Nitrosomonas sp.]
MSKIFTRVTPRSSLSIFITFIMLFVFNIGAANSSETELDQQPIIKTDAFKDIDLSHLEALLEESKKADARKKKNGDETLISSASVAQGISYFQIYAVGSSNIGWEYPQSWQTSTTYDYGGSLLRVAIFQIGYGNPNPATLNGLSRTPYYIEKYCSGGGWHICNVGETIEAWMYYFAFDGQQQGYFTSSSNSTASPFGYWSDSISIQ